MLQMSFALPVVIVSEEALGEMKKSLALPKGAAYYHDPAGKIAGMGMIYGAPRAVEVASR